MGYAAPNAHREFGGRNGKRSDAQQQGKEEAEQDKNKKKGAEASSPGTSYANQYSKKH
jgi:hypothetical protein